MAYLGTFEFCHILYYSITFRFSEHWPSFLISSNHIHKLERFFVCYFRSDSKETGQHWKYKHILHKACNDNNLTLHSFQQFGCSNFWSTKNKKVMINICSYVGITAQTSQYWNNIQITLTRNLNHGTLQLHEDPILEIVYVRSLFTNVFVSSQHRSINSPFIF